MRTEQAVIRLYLKTAKVLADGSSPIMLMVSYNGKKEKSTGCSCTAKFWDKKNQMVKKGYPNYVMLNEMIDKFKQLAIEARNRFIREEIAYTPRMIIDSMYDTVAPKKPKTLKDMVEQYCYEKCVKKATLYNYRYTCRLLCEYRGDDDMIVSEIDERCLKGFCMWLEKEKKISDGVIRITCTILRTLVKYAIEIGLLVKDPFGGFNYTRKFKQSNNILYIHRRTIQFMQDFLLDKLITQHNGRWAYKPEAFTEFTSVNGRWFPLYYYLMIYMFQGVAPIDLAMIKRSQIATKTFNGIDYWAIDIKRKKTNKPVPIRIKRHTIYAEAMMGIILMFGQGEYLMPILANHSNVDDEIKKNHIKWVLSKKCMRQLKEDWSLINRSIIAHNTEHTEPEIPQIDENCTFYSARHSYAQNYMEAGGNALALATLLGRGVEGISVYVKELTRDDDIIDVLLI